MPDQVSAPGQSPLHPLAPWLMIFAHPGHELRAYHAVEIARPLVAVLTDGSGSTAESRLDDSRALLTRAGATPATTFGPLRDRDAYAALMAADAGPFLALVNTLADLMITGDIRSVLVDSAEGYNPVHDVCHWLGRAAVLRARQFGAAIRLFEIDLVSHPDAPGAGERVMLDDEAFARKLEAISRYASLKGEAEAAFDLHGRDAFRVELLRRVADAAVPPASWVPYYEQVGEARVREGRYTSVLRYRSHVKPVIEQLIDSVRQIAYATDFGPPDQ